MKWFKQQLTEITAWVGFFMIVTAFFLPRSTFVFLGIVLICIDDEKAKAWCASKAPMLAEKANKWLN